MARLSVVKEQWFNIPGDEDKARLKIKHLTPGDLHRIGSNTSRWVGKSSKKDPDKFDSELEYDPLAQLRQERLDSIVGWENFFDAEGQQMKCNPANKAVWLDNDPVLGADDLGNPKALSEWIDLFRKALAEDAVSPEKLEKN